jgi:hypothetical protein
VPDNVLIPPHSLGKHRGPHKMLENIDDYEDEELGPGEYSVRQIKEILAPFVQQEQKELDELQAQRLQRGGGEL